MLCAASGLVVSSYLPVLESWPLQTEIFALVILTQAKFVWGKGEFKKKARCFLRKFLEKSIWSCFLFLNKMEDAECAGPDFWSKTWTDFCVRGLIFGIPKQVCAYSFRAKSQLAQRYAVS